MHGHNLSFPRDLDSGEFVDAVMNPVTKTRVAVPPMALVNDPGNISSPEGIVSLDNPTAPPRPKYGMIRREGDFVKIDAIRVPPATWPVTFIEMGYESTPAKLFDDPSQLWLPTDVSGAYVFPWPEWMQMGDRPRACRCSSDLRCAVHVGGGHVVQNRRGGGRRAAQCRHGGRSRQVVHSFCSWYWRELS